MLCAKSITLEEIQLRFDAQFADFFFGKLCIKIRQTGHQTGVEFLLEQSISHIKSETK